MNINSKNSGNSLTFFVNMLRLTLTILFTINLAVALAQSPNIIVNKHTLNVGLPGDLWKVALFHEKFYCMFTSPRQNTSQSFKKMIVISKSGQFIEDVFVPAGIQDMIAFDLIVENDSLYVKETQFERNTFVLGAYVADFKLTKKKEFVIFKDEKYNVSSRCYGEWGGTVYFQNKKNRIKYEASSTCPLVINRIDSIYYVTNYINHMIGFASVLQITDPGKLAKLNVNSKFYGGSHFSQGVETLIDTPHFYIATSFVVDKMLLHLYSDDVGTYLGHIEDKKMIQVYKFNSRFSADFNQRLANGQQVLSCYFKDSKKNGMLIIDGNRFNFYECQYTYTSFFNRIKDTLLTTALTDTSF